MYVSVGANLAREGVTTLRQVVNLINRGFPKVTVPRRPFLAPGEKVVLENQCIH
jgi:hypothetical protein